MIFLCSYRLDCALTPPVQPTLPYPMSFSLYYHLSSASKDNIYMFTSEFVVTLGMFMFSVAPCTMDEGRYNEEKGAASFT